MKKYRIHITAKLVSAVLISLLFFTFTNFGCFEESYMVEFDYRINNNTDKTVMVCFDYGLFTSHRHPQMSLDSLITIQPYSTASIIQDYDERSDNYPKRSDTPELYKGHGMWETIKYITVGNDTVPNQIYSKDKWIKSKKYYILDITNE